MRSPIACVLRTCDLQSNSHDSSFSCWQQTHILSCLKWFFKQLYVGRWILAHNDFEHIIYILCTYIACLDNGNEVNHGVMTRSSMWLTLHYDQWHVSNINLAYTILSWTQMSVSRPFSRTLIKFWQRSVSSDNPKQNSSAVMETICNFIVWRYAVFKCAHSFGNHTSRQ